jgi:adenylate cyclase, class 2
MPPPSRTDLEVEIKLTVRDKRAILDRLSRLGTRAHQRVLEQNTLYDTPSADFRRSGRLVRLRTETTSNGRIRALMTAKAPPPADPKRPANRSRYKERLERETTVGDPRRTHRLLKSLGLRPSFRYEKYRTGFDLPGLHIALDETPVGTFLELEGRRAAIDRVARALGFTSNDYFRGTYWDLYSADCRRKGRKPGNMLFSRKNPR